jgi:C4-dicarboxylate-specific signal transduction histidine kinase
LTQQLILTVPQHHPALALLLISGLIFFWVIPLSSWWMLRDLKDKNANFWFLGTLLYALAATLFIFNIPLPLFFKSAAVSTLALMAVLCMLESQRLEISNKPTAWPAYLILIVIYFGLLATLQQLPEYADIARSAHLLFLSAVEIYLIFVTNQVRRKTKSRALWLIIGMFTVYVLSNMSRVAEMLITGHFSKLLDFTPYSNIGLVVNYLSVIIYSFGYWGFVTEKKRDLLFMANKKASLAQENEKHSAIAEAMYRERAIFMEKLVELGKLAQSGALSASIAHEINQPLAAMSLDIEESIRLVKEGKHAADLQFFLQRIAKSNQRASTIIQRIRQIFSEKEPEITRQSLDSLVRLVCNFSSDRLQQSAITLKLKLNADKPCFIAAGEIEHLLMNLLNNAIEALKSASDRQIVIETSQQSDLLQLTVSDTGPGIEDTKISRIFDLGETDKIEGMGLGLWLSRHIAERAGGTINFDRSEYSGARFIIQIPTKSPPKNNTIV